MSRLRGFKLGPFVVGFVLLLPVLLPVGLIAHGLARRRLRAAAARGACPACGQILGPGAIDLADVAWREFMDALRAEHPGEMFRVVKTIDAICPHCGAQLAFVERNRTFAPAERPIERRQSPPRDAGATQDAAGNRAGIRRDR